MTGASAPSRLLPEQLAAVVIAFLFIVALVSRLILWDWVFDTVTLITAGYVALRRQRPGRLPLVCGYLFLDCAVQALAYLFSPGVLLLVYLLLAGLYGAALRRRLAEGGFSIEGPPWRGLFQPPALAVTAAALVPLACLYLPMLHLHRTDIMMSAPLAVTVGYVTTMSSSHPIDVGGEATYRGVQIALGRVAAVLLAAVLATHLLRLHGIAGRRASLQFMRVAVIAVGAWWLLAARGLHSLDNLYNIVFITGWASLLLRLVRMDVPTTQDSP